ncbi:putative orphan protein [Pseudoalteromonas luteoviolacea B = ATCC 29581]|nr:putative orphan protein [Pseudoalteromonas luteoviolacea B = ATCC 29581]
MGPEGKNHIEAFCAQQNETPWQNSFAQLLVVPRFDKSLPEWEYLHKTKRLTETQISAVLQSFKISQSDLEDQIEHFIADAVSTYMEGKY